MVTDLFILQLPEINYLLHTDVTPGNYLFILQLPEINYLLQTDVTPYN
jgi:hypothetical protein